MKGNSLIMLRSSPGIVPGRINVSTWKDGCQHCKSAQDMSDSVQPMNSQTHLTSIRQMSLQIHMHVHICIFNRANSLDMIKPKTLGHLPKVRSRHGIQEPRYHLLNRSSLLLCQFMHNGGLSDALNVNVLTCLPRSIV